MKYMGSKNRIAKEIIPIMLKDRKEDEYFVDVFAGGCNLIDKVPGKRIANDKNKYLIAMWKGLQTNEWRPHQIPREVYVAAREQYNKGIVFSQGWSEFLIGWVGWMASYNGRFFDGGYSGHCVGKTERDYISEQIRNTEKQIPLLKDVIFTNHDYKDIEFKNKNCVIYCDPPYKGTKQYATSKDFDHDHFWQWCRNLSEQGHRIFISEYNGPEDAKVVWEKEVTNSMNTKNTYKPVEKLFTI